MRGELRLEYSTGSIMLSAVNREGGVWVGWGRVGWEGEGRTSSVSLLIVFFTQQVRLQELINAMGWTCLLEVCLCWQGDFIAPVYV